MPEPLIARQPTPDELPASAISLRGLTKTYAAKGGQPPKRALQAVDLEVPRGSFFALLGPNGAGKSTLINILAGLVVKSAGQVSIFGIDIDAHPRRARLAIGVVPQELNLDAYFSPRETLEFQAGLYGVPKARRRTDEILAAVGLTDQAEAYARSLSGGMRRRLLVAKALVHSPPVVVLDEPTAGVDVELRRSLWDYMRGLNAQGVTVVLTTHYLEEAEALCDRLAIIDHGQVVASGATRELLARLDEKELWLTPTVRLVELPAALRDLGAELLADGRIRVRYRPSRADVGAILERARQAGIGIRDLATSEADLEELFLRLTASRAASMPQGARGVAMLGKEPA
jgi:ABC-2 type transport system ATP-binding protein